MTDKRIIRVFPRRTNATPIDAMSRVGLPGLFDQCDEVHISTAFTWDLPEVERLEKQWKYVAPVKIGGPAVGSRGEEFVSGRYLKDGYTITSRGCPNKCWFCSVWRREGEVTRELPIVDGWNILDDNLLACSDEHIKAVFSMLSRQERKPEFTGGIEAKRLKPWHVKAMKELKTKQLFFAYDTDDDYDPLYEAGKMLLSGGFTVASHALRCYVLCGWDKDTFSNAESRFNRTLEAGFLPMAMIYRDKKGDRDPQWIKFCSKWIRPARICRTKGKESNE